MSVTFDGNQKGVAKNEILEQLFILPAYLIISSLVAREKAAWPIGFGTGSRPDVAKCTNSSGSVPLSRTVVGQTLMSPSDSVVSDRALAYAIVIRH